MNQHNLLHIYPPATIGIIGGGQLGQMLAMKAHEMGYSVVILDPDNQAPAKEFAKVHLQYSFDDTTGLDELAKLADVITTEFENVPASSLEYLEKIKPVYPPSKAVRITQNRLKEKDFFNRINIETAKYYKISTDVDIDVVADTIFPAILKTSTLGYDGKGQIKVKNKQQLAEAFRHLGSRECILEQIVDIKLEASVIVAKNHFETKVYSANENIHHNGILDITIYPARIPPQLNKILQDYAIRIINALNYIGVLVIEFFITTDDKILANEMAPRPHNSGHHTIESTTTSQFEQQLRAICNLRLGDTNPHTKSVMLNILGDNYTNNHLKLNGILEQFDNLKLHLYKKATAKIGRKMGHITLLGNNVDDLIKEIEQIKCRLLIVCGSPPTRG